MARRREPCLWTVSMRTRGEWRGSVCNCRSKAEVLRKIRTDHPDVEGHQHDHDVTTVIYCKPDEAEDD